MIEAREVDNPLYTEGLATFHAETGRPEQRKITVASNAMSRIGALCFIRRREPHHEKAAERFKALCEARYEIGGGAIDPSRTPVDSSIVAHDAGMAARLDRTSEWADLARPEAKGGLGGERMERLVFLIVLGVPAGQGATRRPQVRAIQQALDDVNRLSELFGYA